MELAELVFTCRKMFWFLDMGFLYQGMLLLAITKMIA